MKGLIRFQTKLTIVYLALFLSVQGGILLAIYTSVTSNVRDQISAQLAASARVFDRITDHRIDIFSSRVQDISKEFGFRQALATEDKPTVESALENLIARSVADSAFVISLDNELFASAGKIAPAIEATMLSEELKEIIHSSEVLARFIEHDGELYKVVITPILAPVIIGWIGLAQELDQEVANEFKELSQVELEVAFLSYEGSEGRLSTATALEQELRAYLNSLKDGAVLLEHQGILSGQEFMFRRLPLSERFLGSDRIDALLYYSVDAGLTPFQSLVVALVSILSIGVVLLFLGSLLVSRGVTRPLRLLAQAAERISKGDYELVTTSARDEEFVRLTGSFNQMVSAVQTREKRILHQACHDGDSGLPNRIWFEEQIRPALTSGKPFMLAILEMQNLADIRTVMTHEQISKLVVSIATRLLNVKLEYLSRLSTETFVFVIFDVAENESENVAAMIQNRFIAPFDVADFVVDVRALIGLTYFPTHGSDLTTLLRHANAALDQSRTSPNGFALYDADRDSSKRDHLSMMSDLKDGLKAGEVQFHYQPKLDIETGKVKVVEALVRWVSPKRGFVAPDDFIVLAERTGDIRHLTDWGLEAAVAQISAWRDKGYDLSIAVNLSTNDLMNANLPNQVLQLLTEHDVPANKLKLEVTESAIMHDMSRALDVLNMLHAMGISLSIDDYGTGYSSLSYIKQLPVSEIKIDKSFVLKLAEEDDDKILVRSTIELAHNLGLEVTAEGVENQESADLLRQYGCNKLQGYHICRPMPALDLEEFLKKSDYS
jgi:predicted signal transduction protein with EAL and GGDEF domain